MNYNIQNAFIPAQLEALREMYQKAFDDGYTSNVTGDAVRGDEVAFASAVFYGGDFRRGRRSKPVLDHFEMIYGTIIRESYGADKGQHTFTILTTDGDQVRKKGRNLYRYLTLARPRSEEERKPLLDDKHQRGDAVRSQKLLRRLNEQEQEDSDFSDYEAE